MNTINSNKYYIKNKFIYLLKDVQRKFESDKKSQRFLKFDIQILFQHRTSIVGDNSFLFLFQG